MLRGKNRMLVMLLSLFLLSSVSRIPLISHSTGDYRLVEVGTQSIQKAINSAKPGDTVIVPAGIYYESNIEVNKSITLRGAGASFTVIDGGGGEWPVIRVLASNVRIEGFTIRNTISEQETYGIILLNVADVTLQNNAVENCYTGIAIRGSSNCRIINNTIISNFAYGITLYNASNNLIIRNWIKNNPTGILIEDRESRLNILFHNNIVDNEHSCIDFGTSNRFDNDFEGNYWSDYDGIDLNMDGIGDEHYLYMDRFPLMGPFIFLENITESGYGFEIISNSTIRGFAYNATMKELMLEVEGSNGTLGFCRMSIPYTLIPPPYQVIIDDGQTPVQFFNDSIYSNGTHQWIYFNYMHKTHQIKIVPEGLANQFALLLLAVTSAMLSKKLLLKKRS